MTEQIRIGRNFVRIGDLVRVTKGGADKQGFDAKVHRINLRSDGAVELDVLYTRGHRRAGTLRTLPLDRIKRKAQTKNGEARNTLLELRGPQHD